MKYSLLLFLITNLSFAQNAVIPLEEDFPDSEIKDARVIRRKTPHFKYLSSPQRNEILKKYNLPQVNSMNEMDKDILYKCIVNYEEKDVIAKYPFLDLKKIRGLKNDFFKN